MASNFPTSAVDSFTTKVDGTDYPAAAHINDLQNAVVAAQIKIGIDDSPNSASLDYKVEHMWSTIYPVGSVYISVVNTNPGTLFGGTWEAFAAGRCLVGIDPTDTDFDEAEETRGAKTANLAHVHAGPSHFHTGPNHRHSIPHAGSLYRIAGAHGTSGFEIGGYYTIDHHHGGYTGYDGTGNTGAGGTGNTGSGGSSAQSIVQPSIVVYMWKRVS